MSEERTERRKYPRTQKELDIQLGPEPQEGTYAKVKNISAAGILCLSERPFDVMSRLAVVLNIPYEEAGVRRNVEIECEGVVVRCGRALEPLGELVYEVAIYFTWMSSEDREMIAQMVEENLESTELHTRGG